MFSSKINEWRNKFGNYGLFGHSWDRVVVCFCVTKPSFIPIRTSVCWFLCIARCFCRLGLTINHTSRRSRWSSCSFRYLESFCMFSCCSWIVLWSTTPIIITRWLCLGYSNIMLFKDKRLIYNWLTHEDSILIFILIHHGWPTQGITSSLSIQFDRRIRAWRRYRNLFILLSINTIIRIICVRRHSLGFLLSWSRIIIYLSNRVLLCDLLRFKRVARRSIPCLEWHRGITCCTSCTWMR